MRAVVLALALLAGAEAWVPGECAYRYDRPQHLHLVPTCVVSLAAWRWSDAPAYAVLDRACARSFFVALVATNLLVPDYSLAMWMPAGLLFLRKYTAA